MTAQINDIMILDGVEYEIVGKSGEIDFNPRDFGLVPLAPHTANWRGYYYEASVIEDNLYIDILHVNNQNEDYPTINDVEPIDEKENTGYFTYKNLKYPLNFTGKILIGKDFLIKYYSHMGYQSGHAYEDLRLLTFNQGFLIQNENLSKKARDIRKRMDEEEANPDKSQMYDVEELEEYIEKRFSMGIDEEYL